MNDWVRLWRDIGRAAVRAELFGPACARHAYEDDYAMRGITMWTS